MNRITDSAYCKAVSLGFPYVDVDHGRMDKSGAVWLSCFHNSNGIRVWIGWNGSTWIVESAETDGAL